MTQAYSTPLEPTKSIESITSIENVILALKTMKKELLQQGIHSPSNTFVGIPTEQLPMIDIVLARMEKRQGSLLKSDFSELARDERAEHDQFLNSMAPIVTKLIRGNPSAEDLVQMLAETKQPDHARRIVAGNFSGSSVADELHVQIKSDENLKISKRTFKAGKVYELRLGANSSNFELMKGTATIVETTNDWKFFAGSKRSTARITLDFANPKQLRIFSLCLAFGIEFRARVSPSIRVEANNLVFTGTLVDFLDLPKLHEDIQRSEKAFAGDLFGPTQ